MQYDTEYGQGTISGISDTETLVYDPYATLGQSIAITPGGHMYKMEALMMSAIAQDSAHSISETTKSPKSDNKNSKLPLVNMGLGCFGIDKFSIISNKEFSNIDTVFGFGGMGVLGTMATKVTASVLSTIDQSTYFSRKYFVYVHAELDGALRIDELTLSEKLVDYLSPNARISYDHANDHNNQNEFYNQFGTHFISGLVYGKIMVIFGEHDLSKKEKASSTKLKLNLQSGNQNTLPSNNDNVSMHTGARTAAPSYLETPPVHELAIEDGDDSTVNNTPSPSGGMSQGLYNFNLHGRAQLNTLNIKINSSSTFTCSYSGFDLSADEINFIQQGSSREEVIRNARVVVSRYSSDRNRTNSFEMNSKIGAYCTPFSKYLPNLVPTEIEWHAELGEDTFYLKSGVLDGRAYVYPGDYGRILVVLQQLPGCGSCSTLKKKTNSYELGYYLQGGFLKAFFRPASDKNGNIRRVGKSKEGAVINQNDSQKGKLEANLSSNQSGDKPPHGKEDADSPPIPAGKPPIQSVESQFQSIPDEPQCESKAEYQLNKHSRHFFSVKFVNKPADHPVSVEKADKPKSRAHSMSMGDE